MARLLPRSVFVRGAISASALVVLNALTGSMRRVASPLRGLAASAGVPIGSVRNIGSDGSLSYTDPASGDPALVVRLASGQYVSYDAVCTHAGCTVGYDPTQHLLECPCHGSVFDPAHGGKVVVGPAQQPLAPLAIRVGTDGTVYALDGQAATPTPTPGTSSGWASYDYATNTAHLQVVAGYNHQKYNVNGGARGHFVFTVPLGAKVIISFLNESAHTSHGLKVVANKKAVLKGRKLPRPAFAGAQSADPTHGTPKGVRQTVTFRAKEAGRYLLVCPVHGHITHGEWNWLVVSKTAQTATGELV